MEVHKLRIGGRWVNVYRIGRSDLVSVIIGVREGLPPNLDSVKKQTFRDYEIIIVSGPGTPTSSHARNLGIRFSKTKFIAFLDDDAYPAPDWLEQLLQAYKLSGGDIIESYVINPQPRYLKWDIPRVPDLSQIWVANFALYPRYIFEKIGFYDEHFGKRAFNEVDLSVRALKKGFKIRAWSKARVNHKHSLYGRFPPGSRGLTWQSLFYFLFKHPIYGFLFLMALNPLTHRFWTHYIANKLAFWKIF
jgi:GT2 family glycosyltransferase